MDLRPSDVLEYIRELVGEFDRLVILVGQPCPLFSTAGNHDQWDGKEPVGERAKEHVAMVYHTLGLVKALNPDFWFLENPRGSASVDLGRTHGDGHILSIREGLHEADRSMGRPPARDDL